MAPLVVALPVLTLTVLAFCSLWLGWQVRMLRTDLAREEASRREIRRVSDERNKQKQQLLAEDNLLGRAATLGLRAPAPGQIRNLKGW